MRDTRRRASERRLKQSRVQPDPPRFAKMADNMLTWVPPTRMEHVTHFRIRIDDHAKQAPDFEVSANQTSIQLFKGDTFSIRSYNEYSGLESDAKHVGGVWGSDSNIRIGEATTQGITIEGISKQLTDPNDFGLRFWAVSVDWSTALPDTLKVEIWAENPTGQAPVKVGEDFYNEGSSNTAIAVLEPPAEETEIRVYLVPVTTTTQYELKTVADYGGDASANATIDLEVVPTDDQGIEYCENVTGQSISGPTYFYDSNGIYRGKISGSFTAPDDARFSGVELVAKKPGPRYISLGRFHASPTAEIQVEVPASVESWRCFFVSFDKQGKRNTINETGEGEPTPYDDILIGDTDGKLDLAKALASSIGSALGVVSNVLGVVTSGITEDLIAQFAVSQLKLKNSPIIDNLRLENLSVSTAKVQALAVTYALLGNAAVLEAKIGDLEVTNGKLANLAVDSAKVNTIAVNKITSWSGQTIDVGAGLTFTGSSCPIVIAGGGYISVLTGHVSAQYFNAGGVGISKYQVNTVDVITWDNVTSRIKCYAHEFFIGGSQIVNIDRIADFVSLKIGSTETISSGRVGKFASVQVAGVETVSATRVGNFVSLNLGGVEVLDSSRNANVVSLKISGTTRINSNGALIPRYFSAAARPTLDNGEVALWWDESSSEMNWLVRIGANYFTEVLAAA